MTGRICPHPAVLPPVAADAINPTAAILASAPTADTYREISPHRLQEVSQQKRTVLGLKNSLFCSENGLKPYISAITKRTRFSLSTPEFVLRIIVP
ncbi:hypothetical protein GX48_04798 [Paracoccidioides brasiliensis]|nr:hypothetical protein GX48_04798 [Paracoccidioides brasiliensis]